VFSLRLSPILEEKQEQEMEIKMEIDREREAEKRREERGGHLAKATRCTIEFLARTHAIAPCTSLQYCIRATSQVFSPLNVQELFPTIWA
jgi:hypothetical protein